MGSLGSTGSRFTRVQNPLNPLNLLNPLNPSSLTIREEMLVDELVDARLIFGIDFFEL
jgi:hypothetical protein